MGISVPVSQMYKTPGHFSLDLVKTSGQNCALINNKPLTVCE